MSYFEDHNVNPHEQHTTSDDAVLVPAELAEVSIMSVCRIQAQTNLVRWTEQLLEEIGQTDP